jgi:UDP-N-acetylglucosamine 2-epimerase
MLAGLEEVFAERRPEWVVVYGDTNSTLAAALAAVKLQLPLAHVEAGLRSFNRAMPEEHNRVLTDHCADLLLCPTQTAVDHLAREGLTGGVHLVGDVMLDAVEAFRPRAEDRARAELAKLGVEAKEFLLVTVHRPANTDDPVCLRRVLEGIAALGEPVVFPVHPRTRARLEALSPAWTPPAHVRLIDPLGYLSLLALALGARRVLTDSGGLQKEAFFLGTPCVTLREETEWVETVEAGWNALVGSDPEALAAAVAAPDPSGERPRSFGDGQASAAIVEALAAAGR